MFRFALMMAALMLVGAWATAGWGGVLLAIGSVGLYVAYDKRRGEAHAATIRGSAEVLHSIAQRVSDVTAVLEAFREELRQERKAEKEAEKEKERRRFWRKVEAQDSGGPGQIN